MTEPTMCAHGRADPLTCPHCTGLDMPPPLTMPDSEQAPSTIDLAVLCDDYDWGNVFGYAGEDVGEPNSAGSLPSAVAGAIAHTAPFTRADVVYVKHHREGERDERAWLIAGLLADGRWFYIEASCDYTGWDCQAGGSAWVADTWDQIEQFGLTDEARAEWGY